MLESKKLTRTDGKKTERKPQNNRKRQKERATADSADGRRL